MAGGSPVRLHRLGIIQPALRWLHHQPHCHPDSWTLHHRVWQHLIHNNCNYKKNNFKKMSLKFPDVCNGSVQRRNNKKQTKLDMVCNKWENGRQCFVGVYKNKMFFIKTAFDCFYITFRLLIYFVPVQSECFHLTIGIVRMQIAIAIFLKNIPSFSTTFTRFFGKVAWNKPIACIRGEFYRYKPPTPPFHPPSATVLRRKKWE